MKQLDLNVAREHQDYILDAGTERVLQFGGGNFLRAFVDAFVDQVNEATGGDTKICVVRSISRGPDAINAQDGLYTLILRGRADGEKVVKRRIISSLSRSLSASDDFAGVLEAGCNPELRYVVSNTTEAGIVFDPACRFDDDPPASFPAKLTRILHARFERGLPGLIMLPCELSPENGKSLRKAVLQYAKLWDLGEDFDRYVREENYFCQTLVDRIVTGYPKAEAAELTQTLGYEDRLLTTAEVYALWVIEKPEGLEEKLLFERPDLPVKIVKDHLPYKIQKVRILNGAHTSLVMAAYLAGLDIVRECIEDELFHRFLEAEIKNEIIPTIDLPKAELLDFAADVLERFNNPYIDHELLAITLNSTAKWQARVLPTLLDYLAANGELPPLLTFSYAAYLAFYRRGETRDGGALIGRRGEDRFAIRDDAAVLDFFAQRRGLPPEELVHEVLATPELFGELAEIPGFEPRVAELLAAIERRGVRPVLEELLNENY